MKSIIILEDEGIIALMLKRFLTSQNHSVTGTAKDGKTAIELVEKFKPDLIIMDVHIKGDINGIDTYKKIQGFYEVPAIFLTGNSLDIINIKTNYKNLYVLEKPVSLTELKRTIDLIFVGN
ncbi:MAG: response regulator [Bacteroidota bacterium]